jgi:hypothetical protein
LVAGTLLAVGAMAAPAQAARYYAPFDLFEAPDATQTGQDQYCDDDDLAIGGGIDGAGGYGELIYLNSSRPGTLGDPGNRSYWTVYVDNFAGGNPSLTPRAYTMCDRKGELGDYEYRVASGANVGDGVQAGVTTSCKENEAVVGGGGVSSGFYPDETYLATSAPVDDDDPGKIPDDGWKAVLNDDEGGSPTSAVDGHGICDKEHRPADFDYISRTRKVPDATQKSLSAPCGKRPIVGGGVASKSRYEHGLYINSSFPAEEMTGNSRWIGRVANYDTPDDKARKMVVTAICLK